jgi:anti-sigma factor RsiW
MSSNDRLSHGDLEELLPWHAAGTLDSHEAAEVERAIAADPEFARRFALVREELTETILLNESLGAPSARAMETLFRAIDQDRKVVRRAATSPGLGARIAEFFSPRALAWTASAAVVIVMLQAGVIARLALEEQDGSAKVAATSLAAAPVEPKSFEVASAPPAVTTRGLQIGSYALVQFAPQASMADVNKFLDGRGAAIVDGPKPGGFYRVRVAQGSLSRQEFGRVLKEMEAAKSIVSSALPVE